MIIQTNASDQITELTVKDLWVGSSTAKGPVDLICQQSLRLQSQIIDTNSHTKYILRWPSLHMTPHNTHSLSLCLSLCFHIIWSTHTFSAFWCSSLSVCLSVRTGLEAIMETYAFWRPPVRTLTFEDFTNMQKQQGVWIHWRDKTSDLLIQLPWVFHELFSVHLNGKR